MTKKNKKIIEANLTFADKVKNAISSSESLRERIAIFNLWKYLVKRNPNKFRIRYDGNKFILEQFGFQIWTQYSTTKHNTIGDWFSTSYTR